MKNKLLKLGMLVSGAVLLSQMAAAQIPGYIQSAVDSDARSQEMKDRDAARSPTQVLAMSGVKPGDRVVEFAGFGQYYTTMLSEIVGDDGHVYMFDLPYTGAFAGGNSAKFTAAHPNTSYHLVHYNDMDMPQDIDVVYDVLYYHDLHIPGDNNNVDVAVLNKKIFDALKPGGIYLIIDHNAEPGSGKRDVETIHRIDPEVIKQEVLAAGFELVQESDLLAHPEDDLSKMVFSPGTRGATDRSLFVFRKP